MAFLTMAFLAVVGLFSINLQLINRSSERSEAAEIARTVLNQMKADISLIPPPPAEFTPSTPVIAGPPDFPPPPFPRVHGASGTYEITVRVRDSGVSGVKAVEVQVAWEGGQGVRVETFFRN